MWGWRPALTGTAAAMIVARALAARPPTERDVVRDPGRVPRGSAEGPDRAPTDRSPTDGRTPAEVFAAELRRHAPERPRPIPIVYRPMVTAIVGDRPVHVSTSRASRRALARVRKRAATTGATIHLATPSPAAEVIAHELTHVAHPSPHPRFFDDADRGPEERRAEQVGALMRRSRPVPRPSAAATAATTVIRREPTTTSAASLWDSITSGAGQLYDSVFGGGTQPQPTPPTTTQPPTTTNPVPAPAQTAAVQQAAAAAVAAPAAPVMDLDDQFERLLERLEDRIISELERRGGRFRGGF